MIYGVAQNIQVLDRNLRGMLECFLGSSSPRVGFSRGCDAVLACHANQIGKCTAVVSAAVPAVVGIANSGQRPGIGMPLPMAHSHSQKVRRRIGDIEVTALAVSIVDPPPTARMRRIPTAGKRWHPGMTSSVALYSARDRRGQSERPRQSSDSIPSGRASIG